MSSDMESFVHVRNLIIEWSSGHIRARALHCAAALFVADYIEQGICKVHDLAVKVKADPQSLYRLLRLLASYGIFKEESLGDSYLTELALPLLSNHPESLRAWLAYHDGDSARWQAYGEMLKSIETGKSAFEMLNNKNYFDFIQGDSVRALQFDEGMKNLSLNEEELIAHSYDFSRYKTIIDCGGGLGGQLAQILHAHDNVHGILYELEQVIARAVQGPLSKLAQGRYQLLAGSFFDALPAGADLYILKRVLHDWDDQACLVILKNCAAAMKKNSRLLIIEAVVAADNQRDFVKDIDLAMLVLFGGKERTLAEWTSMIAQAGLKIDHVIQTQSTLSMLELSRLD